MTYPVTTTIAANDNVDTWIPRGGRTVPDVPTYLVNNAVFNVIDFGAPIDGIMDALPAIEAATTAATVVHGAIVFPVGIYAICSAYTTSVPCIFETGARLAPASGVTVYFGSPIQAPRTRILCGDGVVVFTSGTIHTAYPE